MGLARNGDTEYLVQLARRAMAEGDEGIPEGLPSAIALCSGDVVKKVLREMLSYAVSVDGCVQGDLIKALKKHKMESELKDLFPGFISEEEWVLNGLDLLDSNIASRANHAAASSGGLDIFSMGIGLIFGAAALALLKPGK